MSHPQKARCSFVMRSGFLSLWVTILVFSSLLTAFGATTPVETWYPFLKGNKWGFVDAQGHWKIQPAFDGLYDVFDHDLVRVFDDKKWGYIDRSGAWVARPEFDTTVTPYFAGSEFQVVGRDKKYGILSRRGKLVLPLRYDEVVLSADRAWIRSGDRLGVFGLDGKWIHPMTIPWPSPRSMPSSLNSAQVAWFQENPETNGKWGVIGCRGDIVFAPRFDAHRPGRWDVEEWNHPEGTGFLNDRAWVFEAGSCELITSDGHIETKEPFDTISTWAGDLSLFSENKEARVGLITTSGEIVFPPQEARIEKPVEGFAKYSVYKPDSNHGCYWLQGYLASSGKPIVPAGEYGALREPSEGLIAASRQATRSRDSRVFDPRGVFLDLTGHETPIADDSFYAVDSFSDGLSAVRQVVEVGPGSTPHGGEWGFIDKAGKVEIPPQFGTETRFCEDRAWVSQKPDYSVSGVKYALIDRTGKVLTDYRFYPPEKSRPGIYVATQKLVESRCRGNLVILDAGWRVGLGLANAEGKILLEPQFNELGPMADGMIRAVCLKGEDRWTGYINGQGQWVIPDSYTGGTDFDEGSAWVTRQPNDHKAHSENLGWILIDHQGQVLSKETYLSPSFISEEHYRDLGGLTGVPQFIGDLACVASAKEYRPYGDDRLKHLNWGYVDHRGQVVAWHLADEN